MAAAKWVLPTSVSVPVINSPASDSDMTEDYFFFFFAGTGLAAFTSAFATGFFLAPPFFPNTLSQFFQNSGVVPVRTIGPLIDVLSEVDTRAGKFASSPGDCRRAGRSVFGGNQAVPRCIRRLCHRLPEIVKHVNER